jgi:hypothetical protein
MKKALMLFVLSVLTIGVFSQGLLDKVKRSDFVVLSRDYLSATTSTTTLPQLNVWQLTYAVTATSLNLKTGAIGLLSSTGIGIARVNYKLGDDGEPYKTWNVGAMILLGNKESTTLITTKGDADVGILVAGGLGPLSIGPAYFTGSQTLHLCL